MVSADGPDFLAIPLSSARRPAGVERSDERALALVRRVQRPNVSVNPAAAYTTRPCCQMPLVLRTSETALATRRGGGRTATRSPTVAGLRRPWWTPSRPPTDQATP